MRLVIAAATDQREHLASARVDGNQRCLSLLAFPLREQFIHPRQSIPDDVLGDSLQVKIERRVDVDRAGFLRILLRSFLSDVIDEVGRLGVERALSHLQWFTRGTLGGILGNESGIRHRMQNDVPPILRAVGIVER